MGELRKHIDTSRNGGISNVGGNNNTVGNQPQTKVGTDFNDFIAEGHICDDENEDNCSGLSYTNTFLIMKK